MNTELVWTENKSGCFSEAFEFRYQIIEWRTGKMPTYVASFHTDFYGSGKLQEDETIETCKEACQSHHEAVLAIYKKGLDEGAKEAQRWIPVTGSLQPLTLRNYNE